MREVLEIFIPITICLGAFTMVILLRRMEHLEKLKMIEQGMDMSKMVKPSRGGAIKFAFMAAGVGIGILLGNVLATTTSLNPESLYFSMCLLFGGAGLFLGHKMAESSQKKNGQ